MAISVDKIKCNGCGACVNACPVDAIKIEQDKAVISNECVECGACVNECPNQAIALSE